MTATQEMSLADLVALEQRLKAQKKGLIAARDARYGELLIPIVEAQTSEGSYSESEKSTWAGYGLTGIVVTVDGKQFSVSLTITDVARKAERMAEAKAKADAEGTPAPEDTEPEADTAEEPAKGVSLEKAAA